MHRKKMIWWPLMLLPLTLGLTACSVNSPASSVPPPVIPALPLEARQPPSPPSCSPTCLVNWSKRVERLQQKLTAVE